MSDEKSAAGVIQSLSDGDWLHLQASIRKHIEQSEAFALTRVEVDAVMERVRQAHYASYGEKQSGRVMLLSFYAGALCELAIAQRSD